MINQRVIIVVICGCLLVLPFTAAAEDQGLQTHSVKSITFQTPVEFGKPTPFGLEAFSLVHPTNSKPGDESFEIRLVFISKEMLKNMAMNDHKLLQYIKSVFLGTAKKAEKKSTRYFLGKSITGEVLSKKIPKALRLEAYLLTLKDESKLVIAFVYKKEMDAKNAQNIISVVARTLR